MSDYEFLFKRLLILVLVILLGVVIGWLAATF